MLPDRGRTMLTPAEDHSFLRTIAARFRDDGPRLLYADYLDESDDPADRDRAEFIRLQLALAKLPHDHEQRAPLTERQNELLLRRHDEWTRPLKGLADGFEFRRGMIDSVAVDVPTFVERGEELFSKAPIRRVRFRDAGRHVGKLAATPQLAEVTELALCGADLGNGGVNVLLRSPYLGNVRSLDLSFNGLCDGGVSLLAAARNLPHLRALALNDNQRITADGVGRLAVSPHLGGLLSLDVSANDIGDAGVAALADTRTLPRLHTLRVRANHIGDVGVTALARSPLLARLLARDPRLDLRQNAIGSAGVKALAASPHLAAAVELDLSHNQVGDEGLIALAESPHAARLTTLLVPWNAVSTVGVVALARSPLMARLTRIDVSGNPHLSKRGINELWKRRRDFHTAIE